MTDDEYKTAIFTVMRGGIFKPISEDLGDPKDYSVRPPFESILARHLPKGVTPQAARDIAKMLREKREE